MRESDGRCHISCDIGLATVAAEDATAENDNGLYGEISLGHDSLLMDDNMLSVI